MKQTIKLMVTVCESWRPGGSKAPSQSFSGNLSDSSSKIYIALPAVVVVVKGVAMMLF